MRLEDKRGLLYRALPKSCFSISVWRSTRFSDREGSGADGQDWTDRESDGRRTVQDVLHVEVLVDAEHRLETSVRVGEARESSRRRKRGAFGSEALPLPLREDVVLHVEAQGHVTAENLA